MVARLETGSKRVDRTSHFDRCCPVSDDYPIYCYESYTRYTFASGEDLSVEYSSEGNTITVKSTKQMCRIRMWNVQKRNAVQRQNLKCVEADSRTGRIRIWDLHDRRVWGSNLLLHGRHYSCTKCSKSSLLGRRLLLVDHCRRYLLLEEFAVSSAATQQTWILGYVPIKSRLYVYIYSNLRILITHKCLRYVFIIDSTFFGELRKREE